MSSCSLGTSCMLLHQSAGLYCRTTATCRMTKQCLASLPDSSLDSCTSCVTNSSPNILLEHPAIAEGVCQEVCHLGQHLVGHGPSQGVSLLSCLRVQCLQASAAGGSGDKSAPAATALISRRSGSRAYPAWLSCAATHQHPVVQQYLGTRSIKARTRTLRCCHQDASIQSADFAGTPNCCAGH